MIIFDSIPNVTTIELTWVMTLLNLYSYLVDESCFESILLSRSTIAICHQIIVVTFVHIHSVMRSNKTRRYQMFISLQVPVLNQKEKKKSVVNLKLHVLNRIMQQQPYIISDSDTHYRSLIRQFDSNRFCMIDYFSIQIH